MGHLKNLPALCGMRKVDGMVKRISLNRINLLILGYLRAKMPMLWGGEEAKQKLILNLHEIYQEVCQCFISSYSLMPLLINSNCID
jgi:hypothetical protein